jgi:ribulose-bisphosphate carboxylase large chain
MKADHTASEKPVRQGAAGEPARAGITRFEPTGSDAALVATYHLRSDAAVIEGRAQAIAVEQSVEMPLAAIDEPAVLSDIVARVEDIAQLSPNLFEVRIALATATVGTDPAQLFNMLFGNSSLHDDVILHDVELPGELARMFGGPRHGIAGLRSRNGAQSRALTCSALKPQGLAPARLAVLAARFAAGGLDFVKDDHGLADQHFAPFAERVPLCAAAVRGTRTRYVPSLSGDLEAMRQQITLARNEGINTVMIAPMLAGPSNFVALVRAFPDVAFFAHPALGGVARIAPPLLIGKLLRLLGADVVIFPTHGGRFGYTPDTCRELAVKAREPWAGLQPSLPAPAGGITLDRVPEILDFYGPDTMLLIGGSLLSARERLSHETAAFTRSVAAHVYR